MRFRSPFVPLVAVAVVVVVVLGLVSAFSPGCASTPVQRAQHVSVDVHATLAAVQDAEAALYSSGATPAWTGDKHRDFNKHLAIALRAGRALNEAVRSAPVAPAAKVDLATVSQEVAILSDLLAGVLPPDSGVARAIATAKDAILAVLPVFLE